jgi:hypothetical protein
MTSHTSQKMNYFPSNLCDHQFYAPLILTSSIIIKSDSHGKMILADLKLKTIFVT